MLNAAAHVPEMNSLDADLALPHALAPALLLLLGTIRSALPPLAAFAESKLLAEALGSECLASLGVEGGVAGLAEERPRSAHDVASGDHLCDYSASR